jgi:hypothetical protein
LIIFFGFLTGDAIRSREALNIEVLPGKYISGVCSDSAINKFYVIIAARFIAVLCLTFICIRHASSSWGLSAKRRSFAINFKGFDFCHISLTMRVIVSICFLGQVNCMVEEQFGDAIVDLQQGTTVGDNVLAVGVAIGALAAGMAFRNSLGPIVDAPDVFALSFSPLIFSYIFIWLLSLSLSSLPIERTRGIHSLQMHVGT